MIARPHLRSLSLSELLDESFRLYRSNFLMLVKITALVLVPYNLLAFLLAPGQAAQTQAGGFGIGMLTNLAGNLSSGGNTTSWLGLVYSLILQPLLTGALVLTVAQRYQDQPSPIADNFRAARDRLLRLLGAAMLQGLIALLTTAPVMVFACFAGQAYTSMLTGNGFGSINAQSSVLYVWSILLGILIGVPVFVVVMRLTFAPQAIMLEERRSGDSIERSWKLTRGSVWRVIGVGVTVMLLTLVLELLPAATITFVVALVGIDQSIVSALRAGLNTAAEIIVMPFSLIAYTLFFFDLRIRSEGLDLDQFGHGHFMADDYEPLPGA